MASESANSLEGDPRRLAQVHAMGLRHLQIVHYIETPLGDLQTTQPRHNVMPALARQVLAECRRLGILVDLAHSAPAFVDAALDAGDAPLVWSHSWISRRGGRWDDRGYLARSLSPGQARKIAARGGVIGLWTVRVRSDSSYPLYSVGSYADEILRMAGLRHGHRRRGAGPGCCRATSSCGRWSTSSPGAACPGRRCRICASATTPAS